MQTVRKFYNGYVTEPPRAIRMEGLESIGIEMEIPEKLQDGFTLEMFKHIKPGMERVCVVMIADGYSYDDLSFLFGVQRQEINKLMYELRQRLIRAKIGLRYANARK